MYVRKCMFLYVYTHPAKKLKYTIIVFPHLVMLTSTWPPLNTDNVCTLVLLLLLLHLVLLGQSWSVATTIEHLSPGHPWWSHAEGLVTIGCHLVGHSWWRRLHKEENTHLNVKQKVTDYSTCLKSIVMLGRMNNLTLQH